MVFLLCLGLFFLSLARQDCYIPLDNGCCEYRALGGRRFPHFESDSPKAFRDHRHVRVQELFAEARTPGRGDALFRCWFSVSPCLPLDVGCHDFGRDLQLPGGFEKGEYEERGATRPRERLGTRCSERPGSEARRILVTGCRQLARTASGERQKGKPFSCTCLRGFLFGSSSCCVCSPRLSISDALCGGKPWRRRKRGFRSARRSSVVAASLREGMRVRWCPRSQ